MRLSLDLGLGSVATLGGGGVTFAQVLALNPEVAFDPSRSGSAFQERTGALATTPSNDGEAVGSLKNFGTKGGWVIGATDAQRPIMRAAGSLRYLDWDGTDDYLNAALASLQGVAGWTIVLGARNTGSTAATRFPMLVKTGGTPVVRASAFYAQTTGAATASGRRGNADASAAATGSAHANVDIVLTGIGDYTNTDAFVRSNGAQEGSNTSWLTAGVTDSDGGEVALGGFASGNSPFVGRLYSAFVFPTVLTGANLALAERYVAQTMGITL